MPPIRCTLLDDDDPTTNFLNRKLLERLQVTAQVREARNGEEALQVLASSWPDPVARACPTLIFLDVNMPVLNAFGSLDAYQQLPDAQQRTTVVVVLTTSVHPQDLQRLAALPVAGVLTKPLTAEKVQEIVATHFAS